MIIPVRIYAFTESHSTEDKPVAIDLEVDWRDGEVEHAYLQCGERACAKVDEAVVYGLLGGREAAEKLLRKYLEEERLAS